VFSLFQFKYEKATLRITEVKDLKGESSLSIRKQKKIVTYDYNAKLIWRCDLADESNTKVIGSITGEYILPEVSNDILDDGDEWEVNCYIKGGEDALVNTLHNVVKKYAVDALRKTIITSFVDELKKK
jgi:activator of HSP90 ATPase